MKELVQPLPSGWSTSKSKSGRPYFVCEATKATQWEAPEDASIGRWSPQSPA